MDREESEKGGLSIVCLEVRARFESRTAQFSEGGYQSSDNLVSNCSDSIFLWSTLIVYDSEVQEGARPSSLVSRHALERRNSWTLVSALIHVQ